MSAFFTRAGADYRPQPLAASQWSPKRVNGTAVTALAASLLEAQQRNEAPDLQPARLTVDLFRQPSFDPISTRTTRVRTARSMHIGDIVLTQSDTVVARASMVATRPTTHPAGHRWEPVRAFNTAAAAACLQPGMPGIVWGSDADTGRWSISMPEHQDATRKRLWVRQVPVLAEQSPTPFVHAAAAGELANTLTSWGDTGIGYINYDVTIALARLPDGPGIGLEADNHIADHGIAVGAATMYDHTGPFGVCLTSSLALVDNTLDTKTKHHSAMRFDTVECP